MQQEVKHQARAWEQQKRQRPAPMRGERQAQIALERASADVDALLRRLYRAAQEHSK